MENELLKNCPFCNYDSISRYKNKDGYYTLQCGRCGAQMANYDYLPIQEWNTRPDELKLEEIKQRD